MSVHPFTGTLATSESLADELLGTIASLVAFAINFHASVLHVPLALYVVFISLMISALFVAFFTILPPSKVRRPDGTALTYYPHEGFWKELKAQGQLFRDWRLVALFVPLFSGDITAIVVSTLNCKPDPRFIAFINCGLTIPVALYFNIRTRSLSSVFFNVMQIIGAIWIGFLLDYTKIGSRRARGFLSIAAVGLIVVAGWTGIIFWLSKNPLDPSNPPLLDWKDGPFGGFFVLNLVFGTNMVIVSRPLCFIQNGCRR